jgi:hypothetical protein
MRRLAAPERVPDSSGILLLRGRERPSRAMSDDGLGAVAGTDCPIDRLLRPPVWVGSPGPSPELTSELVDATGVKA